jgi:ABC-type transport system substrate-binding protein
LPSADDWIFDLGHSYPGGAPGWGNNELQVYTKDRANIGLDGSGSLRITAVKSGKQWSSARIETRRTDFQPPPGGQLRIEARLALPAGGPGYWPAFWALGAPFRGDHTTWPQAGEIDVMENINGQNIVHGTLHCGKTESGGPCKEDTGLTAQRTLPDANGYVNMTLYRNGKVDAALDAGRQTVDPAARKQAYRDFQQAYVDDPGWAFLVFLDHTYVLRDKWNGLAEQVEPHDHGLAHAVWWNLETWTPKSS